MCVSVCECASVSVCVQFDTWAAKTNIGIFLSGNLDLGLEKSWVLDQILTGGGGGGGGGAAERQNPPMFKGDERTRQAPCLRKLSLWRPNGHTTQ